MDVNKTHVIIKGRGVCSDCGEVFEDEPYATYMSIKKHIKDTGHDFYNDFEGVIERAICDSFVEVALEQ